jgi:dihydrofolate reductase
MDGIDAIVMGRKTFEKVCSFESWPFTKKVFVLSTTLKGIPQNLESVAEIVRGELKDLVHQLSEKGFKNLYIDGGKTFQSFLKENLIDELIISTIPIVVGNGIPLFGTLEHSIEFEHQVTKAFAGGLVQSRYIKV